MNRQLPGWTAAVLAACILWSGATWGAGEAADRVMIEVEAESATVIKPPLVVRGGARGASGGKVLYADPVIWNRPDRVVTCRMSKHEFGVGLAEYAFQAPRDARYRCWFRVWYLDGVDDSFFFRVDDGKWRRIMESKYMAWRWIAGPAMALKAGPHRLQIAGREDNSIMDRFVICSDLRYVPAEETGRRSAVESFAIPVPDKPGVREPTVTYLNHFDDPKSARADFAGGDPQMGGVYWELNHPGRWGKGVLAAHPKAYMLIRGQGNASSDDVTVDFWFHSEPGKDIFSDGKEHHLMTVMFESRMHIAQGPFMEHRARGRDQLFVILDSKHKRLRLGLQRLRCTDPMNSHLIHVPLGQAKASEWHHVAISWEKKTGRFCLAMDGRARSRAVHKGWTFEPVLAIFFGSASYYSVLKPTGGVLDELRIRNVPLSKLISQ